MKMKRFFSFVLSIACLAVLCVPASATTEASYQIAAYSMNVTPLSGAFEIYFDVIAAGEADKLGCESIYLYRLVDSYWVPVKSQTKLEDDPGMSLTKAYAHSNFIQCSSLSGEFYKIEVTIFAVNSYGRDTRSKTFYYVGE